MKAKLNQLLFSIFFLFLVCPSAYAQRDSLALNTLIDKVSKVSTYYPIEKVHIHFDKPYYAVGDTVWLKTYLTYGFHQPSEISKIVYVDILNNENSIVSTLMLPVKDGSAAGSIPLSKENFKQGNYHVRGYTRWMSNFDATYFFNKTIPIGNVIDKEVSTTISLKRNQNNNQAQIISTITYKDAQGNALADKKINWVATKNGEDIAKGKSSTDSKGTASITFTPGANINLNGATLNTTIEANKKSYDQVYPLKSVALLPDFQFFPEGGNLINGVNTKVAVKAVQSNGLSIEFDAEITDNTGQQIAKFKSQHAGMGQFTITPQAGKTYQAKVIFSDGSIETYTMSKSQLEGMNMSIVNTDTARLFIKLSTDSSFFNRNKQKTYYIVGRSGGIVCYAAKMVLTNSNFSAFIPTNKFPTGIAQFTLLNNFGEPMSERVTFINHSDQLKLSVNSIKPTYTTRKKVSLNIAAQTAAQADLSIAVIDEGKVSTSEQSETTILSNLLLTSELRGYIENPNYYFIKNNQKTIADLDLLMLTQGYRRFTYYEILKNRIPTVYYLGEQGIELTGTLRTTTGLPIKGGAIMLQIPDKYFTTTTTSDSEGKFKFSNLVFTDSSKIVVSAKGNANAKNLMVSVDGQPFPKATANQDWPSEILNIDTGMRTYLTNTKKEYENSHTLNEVVIKAAAIKKPTASYRDYTSLKGLSMPEHTLTKDRFKGCNEFLMCIRSIVPGVTYDNYNFYISRDYNAGNRTPMAVFVKGMPVDANYLSSLNPADIESVEVFLRDELGLVNRSYQTNGVLVINTTKVPEGTKISLQELEELIPQAHTAKITPKGYNISKSFYSPKYTATGAGGFGPDLRSTIYWNPRVSTDASGKASVEFFTSDGRGTYKAIVEGIDKNGKIGRTTYRFKVQ